MRGLIWTLLLLLAALPAEAAPHVAASLIADRDSIGADGRVTLGLRLQVAPGWHVYWRNPGDAGLAPDLSFTLPEGAQAGPTIWPTPQRIAEEQLTTYALTGDVLLAVPMAAKPSTALPVSLHASWLVCERICVPEDATLHLDLPAGIGAPSAEVPLFRTAAGRAPRPAPWETKIDAAGVLHVAGPDLGPQTVAEAWFAADAPDVVGASDPQTLMLADGALSLGLKRTATGPLSGVLVLRDPSGEASAYALVAQPGEVSVAVAPGAWRALGLALLGGLLLNVMPCVFPVLAMKAAALARLQGAERGRARSEGVAYLAGVVVTFCAIGGVLLALRQAGQMAGWGFQFQSPVFVAVMAFVLFIVGLNLSGVFTVESASLQGVGQSVVSRGGLLGGFATGALAVLVATPCTVPFMGAAIAAALATPGWLSLAVFTMLGIGLALPYVVLAWVPGLRRALPRPGAWMERTRQALAFPMYATVAWLAWVLAQQTGADGVFLLALGCTALAFAAWLVGLAQGGRRMLLAGAAMVAVGVFAATSLLRPVAPSLASDANRFSADRLAMLRGAGKPVFVDMSAAWCVTCLVNERVALAPDSVRAAFAQRGVTVLRGDWTFRDADITHFLRDHGSDGVPLYVLFPGGDRPAVVLPSLLTPGIVLDALAAIG